MTTILNAALTRGEKASGYKLGSVGPDYYDCSGLIWQACRDAKVYDGERFTTWTFEKMPGFTRVNAPWIDTIVVWRYEDGHGHMGIISGDDKFYSAESVKSGIGYQSISKFHVYPVSPTFWRPVKSDGYHRDLMMTNPQMEGPDVEQVQRIIGAKPDGFYGPVTFKDVEHWQDIHMGTSQADGIVGPKTRAAMGIK